MKHSRYIFAIILGVYIILIGIIVPLFFNIIAFEQSGTQVDVIYLHLILIFSFYTKQNVEYKFYLI